MTNAETSLYYRPKVERINRPMATRLQAYEESSEKVMDVVRRETLDSVENLPSASRTELGHAVISNMKDSLKLLEASGIWRGSIPELVELFTDKKHE